MMGGLLVALANAAIMFVLQDRLVILARECHWQRYDNHVDASEILMMQQASFVSLIASLVVLLLAILLRNRTRFLYWALCVWSL